MPKITKYIPEDFKNLLKEVGSNFELAQGLGGNSSYKENGKMLIKASGMRLREVDNPEYFYQVGISESEYYLLDKRQSGKPSIEVFMHALFKHSYVLHLHSTMGVALSMLATARVEIANELSRQNICLIPYSRPGEALKASISVALSKHEYAALLLQNHGVVYFADSTEELKQSIYYFESLWKKLLDPLGSAIFLPDDLDIQLSEQQSARLFWHANHNWRISPDHCVFLGAHPSEWLNHLAKSKVAELLGVAGADRKLSITQEQLLWFVNVALNLPQVLLPTLSVSEAMELSNWDAEKHRVLRATAEQSVQVK